MPVDAAVEEQFGPYLVYERLGVGGMATVHRALEQGAEGFERMVALKRLLPHLAEDASFIKSFVREAKLASLLNHVNIVQIYELGRVGTEYFITMEYIDGRDVRRVLRHARKVTGPPPINVTVGLLLQLCDALDYAHNKVDEEGQPMGLVHRDISPSNLIVTSGGHLKIIDFGIAKAQSSQLRTQTGRVKGKLAYMAPEAISGSRDLDARSDIWATGVILHELLTARPLFASKNEYQTLLKVQKGDILPPSTFNQACPPELDAIVFRALARHPDERYSGAAELREELLVLKRRYSLQTGYRDVSGWLDWAFGLEPPAGFSGDTSGVMSVERSKQSHSKTPRPPQNIEEEEAVEVVWGGGNVESEDGPVVLEEVPDVSEKVARPRRDTDDDSMQLDDIPTPQPSHGTMPSIYASTQNLVVLTPGSDPGLPPKNVDPALARGTDPPVARGSAQRSAVQQTGPQPLAATRQGTGATPLARTPTGAAPTAPRPGRTTAQGVAAEKKPSDRMAAQSGPRQSDRLAAQKSSQAMTAVDTPSVDQRLAAVRARDSAPPPNDRATTIGDDSLTTNPLARPLTAEELFGIEAEQALSHVSAQMEAMATNTSMPAQREDPMMPPMPSVPIVRFSKSMSVPPVNTSATPADKRPSGLDNTRTPTTKPGVAPVAAAAAPHPREHRRSSNPPASISASSLPTAPKTSRAWILIVAGIVLAAGTAVAVTLAVSGGNKDTAPPPAEPSRTTPGVATPTRSTGTVKFVTEPPDAEIRIGDKVTHAGSPFASELEAGIHQIEIRKSGYKSWLTSIELSANEVQTLRVVLEPLNNSADATLMVSTTPAGLDVIVDGHLLAQKSPIKTNLKVGQHTIAVKQNGVEVWHQNVNAEAASDYEFNPSFTADKLRERAQRVPTPAPSKASSPPPATTPSPAAGSDTGSAAAPGSAGAGSSAALDKQEPAPTWVGGSANGVQAVAAVAQPPASSLATPSPSTMPPSTVPAPKPVAPALPRSASPPIVPPTAIQRVSGEAPSIEKFKNVELPAALSAKVCIDEAGKVTAVTMVNKLDRRVAGDLEEALHAWKYAPYHANGMAIPACFIVVFKLK
ncbi:MAG TPA: protein kinase [Kofleriaceae bacterium]|nr:protein kinase [Kofleriaceae bacterium]